MKIPTQNGWGAREEIGRSINKHTIYDFFLNFIIKMHKKNLCVKYTPKLWIIDIQRKEIKIPL